MARLLLDTNVIVRFLTGDHPVHSPRQSKIVCSRRRWRSDSGCDRPRPCRNRLGVAIRLFFGSRFDYGGTERPHRIHGNRSPQQSDFAQRPTKFCTNRCRLCRRVSRCSRHCGIPWDRFISIATSTNSQASSASSESLRRFLAEAGRPSRALRFLVVLYCARSTQKKRSAFCAERFCIAQTMR
jgi:hypothetical protein